MLKFGVYYRWYHFHKEERSMNKTDFISELVKKTGISRSDGEKVNEVMESNNILGNAGNIVAEIAKKLNIGEDQAKMIFEKAQEILKSGVLDKIKLPFGK